MNSQAQLQDKIRLVQWETKYSIQKYNLLTIHSLLIDTHPKFIFLKTLIHNYNLETRPERARVRQLWTEQLFNNLSQLIRIPIYQNLLQQLDKVYAWATNDPQGKEYDTLDSTEIKVRPTTASTKIRSHSAYSRKTTLRPTSAYVPQQQILKAVKSRQQPIQMNKNNPKIDYTKLKPGEPQFYAGIRSLHDEYEHPKKRLKEYQRKVFYQEEDNSDIEIIELEQPETVNQKGVMQLEQPQAEQAEQPENQQDRQGLEDPNIQLQDNIPLEAEEQGQVQQEWEQIKMVVDRLKPKLKPYSDLKGYNKMGGKQMNSAYHELLKTKEQKVRQVQEDKLIAQLQVKWAQSKGRSKTELKRRAQSARMGTKKIGIPFETLQPKEANRQNMIDFDNVEPSSVNNQGWRPLTAFNAVNHNNVANNIKQAILSGHLSQHITKLDGLTSKGLQTFTGDVFTVHATAPKKKAFEDILRQAQERVFQQADSDVQAIKQAFAKNKISLGANKIAKSITYYQKQLPGQFPFVGHITGMAMLKNPFIKVVKKKKKKKSKK